MISSVLFRNPFPPHEGLAFVEAQNVSYARLLMQPSTASFQVKVDDTAEINQLPHQFGALISIEQDDGQYAWVGMVTKRTVESGATVVQFEAQDHIGALFARAHTSDLFTEILTLGGAGIQGIARFVQGDAASQIETVLKEVDRRDAPPLLVEYDLERGGPAFWNLPEGESVLDYVNELHDMTGWEWGLQHSLEFAGVGTKFLWRRRIGRDLRDEVILEENINFTQFQFTQDASKFVDIAVVVSVDPEGEELFWVAARHPLSKILPPALRGTVLGIRQQTKDRATIQAEADRMVNDPTNRGEHISFAVAESTISTPVNPGDYVRVRFNDRGNRTVERVVRILGTQHNSGSGVIAIEGDVEPEDEEAAR